MRRLNQHIAQLLLLVFILPLSYQSFHIIHHHSENECKNHDEVHELVSELKCREGIAIGETEEECAICEYEFTTYDSPETHPTFSLLSMVSVVQSQFYQTIIVGFNGNNIVLRGPPTTA